MRRYGPPQLADAHLRRVDRVSVHVEPEGEPERVVPDYPKDDYLVALAHISGTDYLVSGDPHLAGITQREDTVPVLTPRQFSALLDAEG